MVKAISLKWVYLGESHKELPMWEGTAPCGVCVRVIDEGSRVITAGTWAQDHGRVDVEVAKDATEARHQKRVLSMLETT